MFASHEVNWKFYCFVELLVYTLYLIFFYLFQNQIKIRQNARSVSPV